jgi:opacity protein-like surface antigen
MKILQRAFIATAAIIGLASTAMAGDPGGINLTPAQRAQLGNAQAADLPYAKAALMPTRVYGWTGFYGGAFGGGAFGFGGGSAGDGGGPISSTAYNNLASGGIGQVSNTIIPGGNNCVGLVGCNVGGPATTGITPNVNPGFRTDAMLPASQNSSQTAALFGVEVGYRKQFDNNFVLGIGADIMGFSHGGTTTNSSSNGSFFNSNGFTANSQATGCTAAVGGVCTQVLALNTSGSVMTVNSGGSTANLSVSSNPNWIGTVRGSAGYAFDRLLIFGSAGLAYSDANMSVTGSYKDTVTSACSGVSNVSTGTPTAAAGGQSFVSYACGSAPVNAASVNQVTTTSITYTGNHAGMLTGFAAGAGAAYAVSDHISLTIEGVYYNLGTVRTTLTGSGTTATTTTTSGVFPPGTVTQVTTAGPATASSFTVSKMIDGAIFKGGVQFKF